MVRIREIICILHSTAHSEYHCIHKLFVFLPPTSNFFSTLMNILVTGGAGYIGSHTVVELLAEGHTCILLDNFCNADKRVLAGIEKITRQKPGICVGDCADTKFVEAVFSQHAIDGVIHFAARKAVGESIEKPILYYQNNIDALLTVLAAAIKHNVCAFVFSSSATVYGEPDTNPIPETAPRKPATSPYGNTKQIGEDILRDCVAATDGSLRAIALRYFNPIGAHPSGRIGELPLGAPNNLVPYLMQAAARKRAPLTVFGNDYPTPDGTCIRDYIHVVDLARAHIAALNALLNPRFDKKPYDVYNVGTGKGTSVQELIDTFEKTTGVPVPRTVGKKRPGDVVACYADARKIEKDLGWKATHSLEQALADAWRWEKGVSGEE